MNIRKNLKSYLENKKYCKIHRKIGKVSIARKNGYVVDLSDDFVLIQEVDDFKICGYIVIPIKSISEIICNKNEKFFDKIMESEGLKQKIKNKHKINLKNWKTIFKSIKNLDFNVIVENEVPDDETFDIGPIIKINSTKMKIRYFNAQGVINAELTKIPYNKITLVNFDDSYINIFSKYLIEPKKKK